MPKRAGGAPPLDQAIIDEILRVFEETGNKTKTARIVGVDKDTVRKYVVKRQREAEALQSRWEGEPESLGSPEDDQLPQKIHRALKDEPQSLDALAERFSISRGGALDLIEGLEEASVPISKVGERFYIAPSAEPAYVGGPALTFTSAPDNTFIFGATGDNHLCSKYERLDVLNDLYDRFEAAGIERVFNTGNWIEGESRFNKHEITVHGMDAQCRYLAKHYPRRKGMSTYAVSGDDHEGWYAQREGVDIGRHAERIMQDHGRDDWVNLGYMEAHIRLVNANTGKEAMMAVVHPGGGSAYAISYSIQKIIEALDGGEKPSVGLYGHYHKLWAGNIRNVWCLQTGTTKDQDSFMRKKKLEAHVGGALVQLEQDPETGAIIGFTPKMLRYFNLGYYQGRWSHSDDVTLPDRSV